MSWKISNHDQKNQNRIYIRNSRIWKIQEIYEKKTARCDNLYYFMSKKLSVVFKKSQKHNEKQSKNTKIWQIKKQEIEIIVNIKKKKIQALINNASNISYMNSHLWKELEIKKRKQEQLLIIRNAKQNKITQITKNATVL